jgi:hypothetical protein
MLAKRSSLTWRELARMRPPPADRHQPQAVRQCGINAINFSHWNCSATTRAIRWWTAASAQRACAHCSACRARRRSLDALARCCFTYVRRNCEPGVIAAEVSRALTPSPSRPRSEGCRGSRFVQHAPAVRQRAIAVDGMADRPVSAVIRTARPSSGRRTAAGLRRAATGQAVFIALSLTALSAMSDISNTDRPLC